MSTITTDPILRYSCPGKFAFRIRKSSPPSSFKFSSKYLKKPLRATAAIFCHAKHSTSRPHAAKASSSGNAVVVETLESADDVIFMETFPITRTETVEGKIFVRLDQKAEDGPIWELTVGCSLPGRWILHWGVSFVDEIGSEWDQPPEDMRPPGSIPIKDYAIETPLQKSSEGDLFHEVKIKLYHKSAIAAINFVLKDEETGNWYQHRGSDFKVPLVDNLLDDGNVVGAKKGFNMWPGDLLSNVFLRAEASSFNEKSSILESKELTHERKLGRFYEEQPINKYVAFDNSATVSVRKCPKTAKNIVYLESDLPGEVVVHWGVCRDESKNWELPAGPHPPETTVFKNKALQTMLQQKDGGNGCSGVFTLDEELAGFLFVLKLNGSTWLNCVGNDFYIPLSSSRSLHGQPEKQLSDVIALSEKTEETEEVSRTAYSEGIIKEIRKLMSGISSEKTKPKERQENILQEIEKLAAEAYSIFRSSTPTFSEEAALEAEAKLEVGVEKAALKICSGTGTGHEILLQGFNWESHKSGRWYMQLKEKAKELSSLGFTVIWLPPPTESIAPEGYMPKDLYNLNSRYGSIDELKDLVKELHEMGIKVLGDAVLNHRCAHFQNQNGVWNIFGGRLNWDDRAVVADDPHFQGRGNKSSGDNFHAAPNIDHSQDFVRKDLKEWLCWLREEIGYDGWRLDFVRGFWGGYVKDYMDASEPYFAVGEYWDSLSYTYGEMDHNQDAHRQRIIDWINATGGAAGAFDVTTKGILHSAIDRCEYWRLSDQKGKPPGVVGWWPSRAVTFIENHDTGSTQVQLKIEIKRKLRTENGINEFGLSLERSALIKGHWRFPGGKEMQGYAYILTHPGTPAVFYDHVFSHYQPEIAALISLRNRRNIHCRSTVDIKKAERDVYAAIVDEKVAVKIGPGHYEPPNGHHNWSVVWEGRDYKVWETS